MSIVAVGLLEQTSRGLEPNLKKEGRGNPF